MTRHMLLLLVLALALGLAACRRTATTPPVVPAELPCTTDQQCAPGSLCIDASCVDQGCVADCPEPLRCVARACRSRTIEDGGLCERDEHCESGLCSAGTCTAVKSAPTAERP